MKGRTLILIAVGAVVGAAAVMITKSREESGATPRRRGYFDDREWDEQALLAILPTADAE